MQTRRIRRAVIAAIAIGTGFAWAGPSETCTQGTTRGNWVYTCEGTLPTAGAPANTRLLGLCSASRTGYWDCSGKLNLGGTVLEQTLKGQAYNQSNCTGTITYDSTVGGQPAGTLDIFYVISDGGTAISGLPTNPGVVLACSLHRIGSRND